MCFIQKMSSNGTLDYSSEVLCMMYVNGDRDDPNRKTAKSIEEIIRTELLKLIKRVNIEKGRQIMMPDILFALRSQIKLLIRICRNSKILDSKAHMRGRRASEVEQSLDIIDFKNRLKNTLDTNVDPLKTDRIQREAARSTLLSDKEYEHFDYCRKATFNGFLSHKRVVYGIDVVNNQSDFPLKNAKMEQLGQMKHQDKLERFRKWLFRHDRQMMMTSSELLHDFSVESLMVCATELTGLIVRTGVTIQHDKCRAHESALLTPDIQQAYCQLSDENKCSIFPNSSPPKEISVFEYVSF